MSYYLHDHPNRTFGQFGWPRAKLGQPGTKLSGVIGVHTTENITDFEGVDNNAENNAAYIGRRADPGSYHTTADSDGILHLVHPRYAAWADVTNNPHALSVSGALQAARWLEMTPARRAAVVKNMAYAIAEIVTTAVAEGYLAAPPPARRITAAEAIKGSRPGFYGHGETNPGRRYDPGQHFDWELFLRTYASAVGGGLAAQGTITEAAAEEQDDDKMLIIGKAENEGTVWIGDGITRRYISTPAIVESYQWLAREGWLKIFKNGDIQTFVGPAGLEALGQDVTNVTNLFTQAVVNQRAGEIVAEVRAHTAHNTDRVLDILNTIPSVPAELVEKLKAELEQATADSVDRIQEQFKDMTITFVTAEKEK